MEREILTFGNDQRVAVFRGKIEPILISHFPLAENGKPLPQTINERIDPANPSRSKLTILRGETLSHRASSIGLFSFAGNDEFDRMRQRGARSSNRGLAPISRMWRLDDFNGPQGPMQVSAAAAIDVGGGDRFNMYENILLGRAYLARLFRRYGSWSDALAAYNWGPGNVDQWIARGRNAAQLPAETIRYVERVLRQALVESVAETVQQRITKQ